MMADDPLMTGDVFTHTEAYTVSDRTELVALCDIDQAKLEAADKRWNVTALFSSAADMMASAEPEIVSICTPTETHLEIARTIATAANPPRAVLCEKPLASNLADAREVVRVLEERGIVLATVYMRRYAENFQALKRLIDSGELGSVQAVTGWYIGGTVHNGTHWFDMLRFLAGEAKHLHALNMLCEEGSDPTLEVALWLTNGGLATLRACDARKFTLFEMDIVLDKGRAQILDSGHVIQVSRAAPSPRYTGYTELVPYDVNLGHRKNLALRAVEDIVEAVTLGRQPACTGEDGIAAMRIADAAFRSLESGEVVSIE
jgi:predicted dehydrogenase